MAPWTDSYLEELDLALLLPLEECVLTQDGRRVELDRGTLLGQLGHLGERGVGHLGQPKYLTASLLASSTAER